MNVSARGPVALLLLLALGPAAPASALASSADAPAFSAELEIGAVWQSRNDVRIPNSADATRFSLTDVQGHGPWPAARLYVTWNLASRHELRALAAPLFDAGRRSASALSHLYRRARRGGPTDECRYGGGPRIPPVLV